MNMRDAWEGERNRAVLSLDVGKFRKFYEKWRRMGIYEHELPSDDYVIEIIMRQMVLGIANAPKKAAEEARKWLKERGLNPNPWGVYGESRTD